MGKDRVGIPWVVTEQRKQVYISDIHSRIETCALKLSDNFINWEFSTLRIQTNCFTHVTFHFQNRTSPHHQDLLTQTIYFRHEHYQTWLHNTQLIINEMRLEAGKLIAAVNGECGRKKLPSKQKNTKSLQLGPIN